MGGPWSAKLVLFTANDLEKNPLQLVDSQYALFFDLPPIVPTDLLRARMPSTESLWHAPTALVWNELMARSGQ